MLLLLVAFAAVVVVDFGGDCAITFFASSGNARVGVAND